MDSKSEYQTALEEIASRLRGDWYDPFGDLESDISRIVRRVLGEDILA